MVNALPLTIPFSPQLEASETKQQYEERSDVPAYGEHRKLPQQVFTVTVEALKSSVQVVAAFFAPPVQNMKARFLGLIKEEERPPGSQEPSPTTPYSVIAVASQVTATGVIAMSNGSSLSFPPEWMWHAILVGCQVALIASTGAIFLQDKKPKAARFMVNIGTVAVVLSAIGMASTTLTKDAIWLGTIPSAAILGIITAAAAAAS